MRAKLKIPFFSAKQEDDELVDFTDDTRLLLEAVKACGGYYGLGVPCAVLKV